MTPRTPHREATLDDYRWLYAHTDYQADGLKCARDALLDLVERMPASVIDIGGGRGHLAQWLLDKTTCTGAHTYDPATDFDGKTLSLPASADIITCFDVLEHLHPTSIEDFIWTALANRAEKTIIATICTESDIVQVGDEWVELHTCRMPVIWWVCLFDHALPGWSITRRQCAEKSRHLFIAERPVTP